MLSHPKATSGSNQHSMVGVQDWRKYKMGLPGFISTRTISIGSSSKCSSFLWTEVSTPNAMWFCVSEIFSGPKFCPMCFGSRSVVSRNLALEEDWNWSLFSSSSDSEESQTAIYSISSFLSCAWDPFFYVQEELVNYLEIYHKPSTCLFRRVKPRVRMQTLGQC